MKLKASHIKTVTGKPSDLMYYVDREEENGDGRIVFGNGHMLVIVARHEFPSSFALHRRIVDTARFYTEQEPGETLPDWRSKCKGCKAGDRLEPKTVEDKPELEIIYHNATYDQFRPLTDGNGTTVCINEKYYQVIKTLQLSIHIDKKAKDPTITALSLTDTGGDFAGLVMPVRS